ncbi:MAG: hypothetical protein ACRETK_12395, partial [Steroidobacteraceae bacterium]
AHEIGAAVRRQVEQAVVAANAGVHDPAAALARGLCVFLRFGIEHRDSAQVLWRLNPGSTMAEAPINQALRSDLARGIRAGRFKGVDVELGVLLVMGAAVIGMRHALEERVMTPTSSIATGMAAGMLRALGVSAARAGGTALAAVSHVFAGMDGADGVRGRPRPSPRHPSRTSRQG